MKKKQRLYFLKPPNPLLPLERATNRLIGSTSRDRKRLVFVALFVFSLFCSLILQFYKIQILEGEKWTRAADAQHQLIVVEPFQRGVFYANHTIKKGHPEQPQPLVFDVPKFHLFVDPSRILGTCKDEITDHLAALLHLKNEEKKKLREQLGKKSKNRKLRMWLDKGARDEILQWWSPYARRCKLERNALYFTQVYKRSYPFGKLLGQVLHTVRESDGVPTGGLELLFNRLLKGTPGKRMILRSPRYPLDSGKVLALPENGADIYLSINHYLQAIAEEEIARAVERSNAKSGSALIMHPRTGEIFALAQYPFFEPANYSDYFNDPKRREDTKVRAITDPYEPGSTMKPLTMVICLKANQELKNRGERPLFSPHEKIETANGRFPGRSTLIKDTRTHSFLNMYLAIQKSSDVYMARMVQRVIERLGANWYRSALQELFGFGKKTGIELPSEAPGMVPTPGKKYANGALQWSLPTPYSLSYGYNILVNSLQMARCYAILANGGYDVKPTLLRKIVKTHRDGQQEIILDNTSEERVKNFVRLLDPEIISEVVIAMKAVTKPGGTAPNADVYGYTEVGKTGTTEKMFAGTYSKERHFSNFVGFAPAKNPEFVIVVTIDEPEKKYMPGIGKNHHGGGCCAPAFREIATRTLQYLGVEPDDPYGYPIGDPRYNPEKADWIRECRALKELYVSWNTR
jgi:cell division protein FtsI (penicillin-binding protein 3)